VVLVVGLAVAMTMTTALRGVAKLEARVWPVELQSTLEQEPGGFTFNEYADGGYLIYFAPHFKPFVDDRCELFGGPFLVEFVNAEQDGPKDYLARMQERYGPFRYALTRTGSGFDLAFRENTAQWVLVKDTATANLYRRK
jgi:hypothetical protein